MELRYLLLKNLGNLKFQLTDDYIYKVKNDVIVVPAGFKTDFASVPKIFRNLILPYGKHTSASVVHDWLYSKDCQLNFSRRKSDKIFLEIMLENGVSYAQAIFMYTVVRIFGKGHFRF